MSAQSASSSGTHDGPGCYLIVHNVSKRHNIGTLVRSAAAFGVTEVPCTAWLGACQSGNGNGDPCTWSG